MRGDVVAGYRTLPEYLAHFKELYCVPIPVNIDDLDEGNGVEDTLRNN